MAKIKTMNKTHLIEFSSITDFVKYINETPTNDAFKGKTLYSEEGSYTFTKTGSYEEAINLLKNGWKEVASEIALNDLKNIQVDKELKSITENSVCGFQPIVPLYLSGCPQNMINKKMIAMKQKVITVTKMTNYMSYVSTDTIIKESIKALQIVKKLESQGYRVNLNICNAVYESGTSSPEESNCNLITKIKIKNANERLNVSKLSFPLVHPSMLRRLIFRFKEVFPLTTHKFVRSYGKSMSYDYVCEELKKINKNEIVIPAIFNKNIEDIENIEDLR